MLRVFLDRQHYVEARRRDLVGIAKAHWNDRSSAERLKTYGAMFECFRPVERPEDADLCILTNIWPHYVESGRVDLVRKAIGQARRAGKPFVVFHEGDYTANLPFPDAYLFESSTYRSRRHARVHALPPFFGDTLAKLGGELEIRQKSDRPSVGFCGQAGGTRRDFLERRLSNLGRNLAWKLGLRTWEPPPFEHTVLRKRILDLLAASPLVESRFLVRDQYRAGLSTKDKDQSDAVAQSEREFLANLVGADYTVCVRGGGNWSKRFYEALCVGRLPLLIDTDCVLPFDRQVDWSRYVCSVDVSEVEHAPRLLAEYHARLSQEEFAERQQDARRLWLTRLTSDGFFRHFHEHFPSFEGR